MQYMILDSILKLKEPINGIVFHRKFLFSQQNLLGGKAILLQWDMQKAKKKLTSLVERYAKQLGVGYNDILIYDLIYCCGTYKLKENLNFNLRLIKALQFVIN